MHSEKSNTICVGLCELVNRYAKGNLSDFNVVLNRHNDLLRSCGGKTGDDSRLAFKDLKQAVSDKGDVKQAAQVLIQALAHEFEAAMPMIHSVTHPQGYTVPKDDEPKEPPGTSGKKKKQDSQ